MAPIEKEKDAPAATVRLQARWHYNALRRCYAYGALLLVVPIMAAYGAV